MKRKILCLVMALVSFGTLQATEAAQDSGYTVIADEVKNVPRAAPERILQVTPALALQPGDLHQQLATSRQVR